MAKRPEKGTPEYDLWVAAIEIAAAAPLKQGANSYRAGVPWRQIHELRKALDDLGIDWREVRRKEREPDHG